MCRGSYLRMIAINETHTLTQHNTHTHKHTHAHTHSSGPLIIPSDRSVPNNTQHSQQTDIRANLRDSKL